MRTVQENWEQFSQAIAPESNDTTREMLKAAFYTGSMMQFEMLVEAGSGDLSEDAYCHVMMGIETELRQFFSTTHQRLKDKGLL